MSKDQGWEEIGFSGKEPEVKFQAHMLLRHGDCSSDFIHSLHNFPTKTLDSLFVTERLSGISILDSDYLF